MAKSTLPVTSLYFDHATEKNLVVILRSRRLYFLDTAIRNARRDDSVARVRQEVYLHRLVVNDLGDCVGDRDGLCDPIAPRRAVRLRAGIVIDQASDRVPPSTQKRFRRPWPTILYRARDDRHDTPPAATPWDLTVCAYKEKVSARAQNSQ